MIGRDCIMSEAGEMRRMAEHHRVCADWAGRVSLVCGLLLVVLVIGAMVAAAVVRVARQWERIELQEAMESRAASGTAELRGAGAACRAWARAEDYPVAVDEMQEAGND